MFFSAAETAAYQQERPRPATAYDAPGLRVLVFGLEAGQQVLPHSSPSLVIMTVISGQGFMTIGDQRRPVAAGVTGVCPPDETHGFEATEKMVVQVTIVMDRR